MSKGYIDSASIYAIVQALSCQKPEHCMEWAWQSALQTSTALVGTNHLAISPGPGKVGNASGPYGELTNGLAHFMATNEYRPRVGRSATKKTQQWVLDNSVFLQKTYGQLKVDSKNFAPWMEWCIAHAWLEHAPRLQGLFNLELIPQIAQILETDESVLKEVWTLSCNPKIVAEYVKKRPNEDNFRLMCDAYVIAALLRGWYHEYIAWSSSWQIMHHLMRLLVLPSTKRKVQTEFSSLTAQYLANAMCKFS